MKFADGVEDAFVDGVVDVVVFVDAVVFVDEFDIMFFIYYFKIIYCP